MDRFGYRLAINAHTARPREAQHSARELIPV
jgi:hypothetical protein